MEHDRRHGGFDAVERARNRRYVAKRHVDPRQGDQNRERWQHEERTGCDPTPASMYKPPDVSRQLRRLGTRQTQAVVERVQEARLGDPAFLLDQLAMHDRDLSGRAAEADPAELPPIGECLAARRRQRRVRRRGPQMSPSRSCTSTSSPAAMLPVSLGSTMKQFACDIEDRMPEPWSTAAASAPLANARSTFSGASSITPMSMTSQPRRVSMPCSV